MGQPAPIIAAEVVGGPGLAFNTAASRVASSSGEAVGGAANGEAITGELKVVEVAVLMEVLLT